jgi:SAM-dependent methyltransferase
MYEKPLMAKRAPEVNEDFSARSKLADLGRWYITQFVRESASSLPSGAAVLDAGAGECVYRRFFSHCNYKSVDLAIGETAWNYANLDYVAPLDNLPIENNTFDAVLCTEVLEHLEWPRESVQEFFRVMKPAGRLFLTVPMAHDEHQVPYDFFRYTSYGLRSICGHAGFEDIEISPLGGGMFVRWAYEMPRMAKIFPTSKIRDGQLPSVLGLFLIPVKAILLLIFRISQIALLAMDRFDKSKDDPLGWTLVARKPSA